MNAKPSIVNNKNFNGGPKNDGEELLLNFFINDQGRNSFQNSASVGVVTKNKTENP